MNNVLFSVVKNVMTKKVIAWFLIVSMIFTSAGMTTFADSLAGSDQEVAVREEKTAVSDQELAFSDDESEMVDGSSQRSDGSDEEIAVRSQEDRLASSDQEVAVRSDESSDDSSQELEDSSQIPNDGDENNDSEEIDEPEADAAFSDQDLAIRDDEEEPEEDGEIASSDEIIAGSGQLLASRDDESEMVEEEEADSDEAIAVRENESSDGSVEEIDGSSETLEGRDEIVEIASASDIDDSDNDTTDDSAIEDTEDGTTNVINDEITISTMSDANDSIDTLDTRVDYVEEIATVSDANAYEIATVSDTNVYEIATISDATLDEIATTSETDAVDIDIANEDVVVASISDTLLGATGKTWTLTKKLYEVFSTYDQQCRPYPLIFQKGGSEPKYGGFQSGKIVGYSTNGEELKGYFNTNNAYKKLVIWIPGDDDELYLPEDAEGLFGGMGFDSIEGLGYLKTSNTKNMTGLFNSCQYLTSLDLSTFDTSNVTTMDSMFYDCRKLKTLVLSNFDTSKVTNMNRMFAFVGVENLNLVSFDTGAVTNMSNMFADSSSLTIINYTSLYNFVPNDSCITNDMFSGCNSLVGGNGTAYSTVGVKDGSYAYVDGVDGKVGYFTESGISRIIYHKNVPVGTLNPYVEQLVAVGRKVVFNKNTWTNGDSIFVGWNEYAEGTGTMYADCATYKFDEEKTIELYGIWADNSNFVLNERLLKNLKEINGINVKKLVFADATDISSDVSTTIVEVGKIITGDDLTAIGSYPLFGYYKSDGTLSIYKPANAKIYTPVNSEYLFSSTTLESIENIDKIITTKTESMNYMFQNDYNLESFDMSKIDTQNVKSMIGAFQSCTKLKSIDFHENNIEQLRGIYYIFQNCTSLENVVFNTTNSFSDTSYAFENCTKLKTVDWSKIVDAYRLTKTDYMFNNCVQLERIYVDKTNWNDISPESSSYMFNECRTLEGGQGTRLNIGYLGATYARVDNAIKNDKGYFTYKGYVINFIATLSDTTGGPVDTMYIPSGGKDNLPNNPFEKLGYEKDGWVVGKSDTLTKGTAYADGAEVTANDVDNNIVMEAKLNAIPQDWTLGDEDAHKVSAAISSLGKSDSVKIIKFVQGGSIPTGTRVEVGVAESDSRIKLYGYYNNTNNTFIIHMPTTEDKLYLATDGSYEFANLKNLTSIEGLTYLDTTRTTNMSEMFSNRSVGSGSLQSLDLSKFNTSAVTNMGQMFHTSTALKNITFGDNFVATSVVGDLNILQVDKTGLAGMFYNCKSIEELDLSNFDTTNVKTMCGMFKSCKSLKNVNLSNKFVTTNVVNMDIMFGDCSSLQTLDLTNFDTHNVTVMGYMFYKCSMIKTIVVSRDKWSVDRVDISDGMFNGAKNIVGCNGTTYNGAKLDKSYARIDLGDRNPGYLTAPTYSITYMPNGALGKIATDNVIRGDDATILKNEFIKVGYSFDGWCDNADGTGTSYTVGSTIPVANDIVLYAKWSPITYTIHFDKNGATGTEPISDQTFTYGEEGTLSTNTFTYDGYNFLGWSTIKGGSVEYSDGAQVFNWATENKTITLYAVWQKKDACAPSTDPSVDPTYDPTKDIWTIVYIGNGGTGTVAMNEVPKFTEVKLNANSYNRAGYSFTCWNTAPDGNGIDYEANATITPTSDMTLYAKWTANTFTIKYDANGGVGEMPSQNVTYGEYAMLTKNVFTKNDYIFSGWSLSKTGPVEYMDEGIGRFSMTSGGSVTLYAIWTSADDTEFTLTYNANGATSGSAPTKITADKGDFITIPGDNGMEKVGYTFICYNTSKYGDGKDYYENDTFVAKYNLTLYAKWSANTYTINFNNNGGVGEMGPQEFIYDSQSRLIKNIFTKENYAFAGWSKEGSTNIDYTDQAIINNVLKDGSMTLTAVWKKEFTLTYDANGAPYKNLKYKVLENENTTIKANTFVKDGYSFGGWYENATGTGASYTVGSNLTLTADKTLYAKWSPITYKVVYDKNADGATGTMTPQTFTYDTASTLSTNGYTYTNYTFVGWSTICGGDVEYENATSATFNLTKVNGATVTLYAVWTKNTTGTDDSDDDDNGDPSNKYWHIVYNGNGGTGEIAVQEVLKGESIILQSNLGGFDKVGYDYDCWNTAPDGLGQNYGAAVSITPISDMTLYAKWAPKTYNITYDSNGGTGVAMTTQNLTYDKVAKLNKNTYTKDNSVFSGWSTTDTGDIEYDDEATGIFNLNNGNDVTLYAIWTDFNATTFTITYDANEATSGSAPTSLTKNKNEYFIVSGDNGLKKDGYVFAGWNTAKNGSGTNYNANVKARAVKNLKLYAKWVVNTYTIVYDNNGASGKMGPQKFTYDVKSYLIKNSFKKVGYLFGGWSKTKNGTKDFDDRQNVSNVVTSGTLTLYAIWTPITYTITFDRNGGSRGTDMASQTLTYDKKDKLNFCDFEKQDEDNDVLTFIGWTNVSSSSEVIVYQNEEEKIFNLAKKNGANITFYAIYGYRWDFLKGDGGTGVMKYQGVLKGTTVNLKKNEYKKAGARFDYWLDENGVVYKNGDPVSATKNKTFTANWQDIWLITFATPNSDSLYKGTMESIEVDRGKSFDMPSNKFTHKKGNRFLYFYTASNKNIKYEPGNEITPESDMLFVPIFKSDPIPNNDNDSYDINNGPLNPEDKLYHLLHGFTGSGSGSGGAGYYLDINYLISRNMQVPYVLRLGKWIYDPIGNHWSFRIDDNRICYGQPQEFKKMLKAEMEKTGETNAEKAALPLYEKSTDYLGLARNGWYYIPYIGNYYAWYYFDEFGHMTSGKNETYGARYYLNSTPSEMDYGSIERGWTYIDGNIYNFSEVGKLYISGTDRDGNVVNSDGRYIGKLSVLQVNGVRTCTNSSGGIEYLNLWTSPVPYVNPVYAAYLLMLEEQERLKASVTPLTIVG